MTPFGRKLRLLRRERGITMKAMAAAIGVSPAYLSALEHGRRGAPTWSLVQRIIQFFNVIWDDAEELAQLAQSSDPRVKVETAGLSAEATLLANLLARRIGALDQQTIAAMLDLLKPFPKL